MLQLIFFGGRFGMKLSFDKKKQRKRDSGIFKKIKCIIFSTFVTVVNQILGYNVWFECNFPDAIKIPYIKLYKLSKDYRIHT